MDYGSVKPEPYIVVYNTVPSTHRNYQYCNFKQFSADLPIPKSTHITAVIHVVYGVVHGGISQYMYMSSPLYTPYCFI